MAPTPSGLLSALGLLLLPLLPEPACGASPMKLRKGPLLSGGAGRTSRLLSRYSVWSALPRRGSSIDSYDMLPGASFASSSSSSSSSRNRNNANIQRLVKCKAEIEDDDGAYDNVKSKFRKTMKKKKTPNLRQVVEKIENGVISEDLLVDEDIAEARRLGLKSIDLSSPVQKQYAVRVRRKLNSNRKQREIEERISQPGYPNFTSGKKLFEAGEYKLALDPLQQALEIQGPLNKLGGEIQLYIAFCLDAMGNTKEACKVLRIIEDTHPSSKTVTQAEEIRAVFEAPIKEVEQHDLNWGFQSNADRYRPRDRRIKKPVKPKFKESARVSRIESVKPSQETEIELPAWLKNPVVIIITTVGVSAVAWQSAIIAASQRTS